MDSRILDELDALKDSDPEKALEGYRRLLESAQNIDELAAVTLNEVSCLWRLSRTEQARKRLKELESVVPETSEIRMHIDYAEAIVCMADGKDREALRRMEKVLSEHPRLLRTPNHHFLYEQIQSARGILLANLEQCKEALPILEEAFAFKPDDATLSYYLGHCYCALGKQMERARQRLTRALEAGLPKDLEFRAHFTVGIVHYQLKSYARAYEQFKIAADDPEADKEYLAKGNVWQWLAWSCQWLGMTEAAEQYAKVAKICPPVKR